MRSLYLAVALAALPGAAALAQADPVQMAHIASANQTGLMEYCKSKGWADQAAVDSSKASAAALPPLTGDSGAMVAAESTGLSGSLLNNGTPVPLSSVADQDHTTVQALCGKMVQAANMVAAQRRATPPTPGMAAGMPNMPAGMPNMPAGMPNMPSIPAMPNGMNMPSISGVPKTN